MTQKTQGKMKYNDTWKTWGNIIKEYLQFTYFFFQKLLRKAVYEPL